MLDYRAVI